MSKTYKQKIRKILWSVGRKIVPLPARYYVKVAFLYLFDREAANRLIVERRTSTYPAEYHRSVLKSEAIDFVPPVIVVSVADNCNLRCPNCLYVLEDGGEKFFNSTFDLVKLRGVLEGANAQKSSMMFLTGGEPLMHKEFGKVVDLCQEYNQAISISTNGVLLERHIPALRKLNGINVSVDSYDFETFNKYRGGNKNEYTRLLHGLKVLKEEGISFTCSFVLSEENIDEIGKMLDFCADVKPFIVHFHNINPHNSTEYTSLSVASEKVREAFLRVVSRTDYDFDIALPVVFDYDAPHFNTHPCAQLWQYFNFNTVGDLAPCCHLAHENSNGNVFESDVINQETLFSNRALNSPELISFRRDMINGNIHGSCRLCQRRFANEEVGYFQAAFKTWTIHPDRQSWLSD